VSICNYFQPTVPRSQICPSISRFLSKSTNRTPVRGLYFAKSTVLTPVLFAEGDTACIPSGVYCSELSNVIIFSNVPKSEFSESLQTGKFKYENHKTASLYEYVSPFPRRTSSHLLGLPESLRIMSNILFFLYLSRLPACCKSPYMSHKN
jgi:hypothetical protein